jgi:hypothetical protein
VTELGERGQRLWDNLLAREADLTDEANPAREVAITACRTADRVELLEQQCLLTDPVLERPAGGPMIHPLYVEVRNQAALLSRLIAALRLPDIASGKKPEHRQVRGAQQPTAMSSLERARAKAAS